jgi:PmbA protein
MVKKIDRGVLVCRFSGGRPGNNGDFAGVAKNSYLIHDGEISLPLSETMVSGNAVSMLKDIAGISKDRVDYGSAILPWVHFTGMTVSGK